MQYLDNEAHEGYTTLDTTGSLRDFKDYAGPITRCTIHRRHVVAEDNCGGVGLSGHARDLIVENCEFRHSASRIRVDNDALGVLLRNNRFVPGAETHYEGNRLRDALVIPPPDAPRTP